MFVFLFFGQSYMFPEIFILTKKQNGKQNKKRNEGEGDETEESFVDHGDRPGFSENPNPSFNRVKPYGSSYHPWRADVVKHLSFLADDYAAH